MDMSVDESVYDFGPRSASPDSAIQGRFAWVDSRNLRESEEWEEDLIKIVVFSLEGMQGCTMQNQTESFSWA